VFSFWYYTATDDRTPADIRAMTLELRQKDEFFARNDMYIKDCIEMLGGSRALAGLVYADEFPAIPPHEELERRAKGTVNVGGLESYQMTLAEFAASHPEIEFVDLFTKIAMVDEVKGQVAYRGIIQGPVRIVKNAQQMQQVLTGEVMVSPMTTPDYAPGMQKAAAIVTDEGGITCHAAIVSRELGKPCVVGTKIATKVFKDGDLVEVDAERGVVRKI
jgi:phosphohistidine swiveling domain-containing protein